MPISIPMADEPKGLGLPGAVQVQDSGATSVADAISKLGNQGAKLAEHMLQQRTKMQGEAYVSNALSTYQQEYLNKTQELEQKYSNTDGVGIHKEMMEWDKTTKERLRKGAPSGMAVSGFDQSVTKLSTSALINADTTEQGMFTKYHTKKLDENLKDLTNNIPLLKDQIVETTESSLLTYKDNLALAQSMGLINAEQAEERDKLAGTQFALAAGNNAASQADFTEVARIVGGGERFVPMALAYMDKYYPPGTKENDDARAYMVKKIKSTGPPTSSSRLEKYLTAEQKEALIRDTMQHMKFESEVETSDLNERIKEMNAKLGQGIPTDVETVRQLGALNSEINNHEKFKPFQKINRTLGFHIRMAGGEIAKVFKVLPETKGLEVINQFRTLDFSNPANQKEAEAFMTQMGFTPEVKALFIKNPTVAAAAIKEISGDLLRKYDKFWNDVNKDSGNTLYLENKNIQDQWKKAKATWNLNGDTADTILSSKEFQKAIIMTKSLEAQMGIPSNKATTIPMEIANGMMSDLNSLYQQGDYRKVDIGLDAVKSVLSLKDQYPGMFNNIEKRMVEASNDDFFTAETAFIMRLPSGPEREQLIKNNTPDGQKFIKDKLEGSEFTEAHFTKILTDSPEWRQFEASMATDMYSAVKAEGLKKLLTTELIRSSTSEPGVILKKEKPSDIGALATPKHIQKVMTNYIDKNYTVFASGGARISMDNGAVKDAIAQWSEEDQFMAKAPRFNEALMLSAELTSRDTAINDPNVMVPQSFIDQAAMHVKAGKGIFSIGGVTARLDDPQTVKKIFLDSAVMYSEGNDAFVFKVGDAILLNKNGQPYRISTSEILNSNILKDYVRGGTEKPPLLDYFIENKLEKMQRKSKKVGTQIKKVEKLENKQAKEVQDSAEEALGDRLDI